MYCMRSIIYYLQPVFMFVNNDLTQNKKTLYTLNLNYTQLAQKT